MEDKVGYSNPLHYMSQSILLLVKYYSTISECCSVKFALGNDRHSSSVTALLVGKGENWEQIGQHEHFEITLLK